MAGLEQEMEEHSPIMLRNRLACRLRYQISYTGVRTHLYAYSSVIQSDGCDHLSSLQGSSLSSSRVSNIIIQTCAHKALIPR